MADLKSSLTMLITFVSEYAPSGGKNCVKKGDLELRASEGDSGGFSAEVGGSNRTGKGKTIGLALPDSNSLLFALLPNIPRVLQFKAHNGQSRTSRIPDVKTSGRHTSAPLN